MGKGRQWKNNNEWTWFNDRTMSWKEWMGRRAELQKSEIMQAPSTVAFLDSLTRRRNEYPTYEFHLWPHITRWDRMLGILIGSLARPRMCIGDWISNTSESGKVDWVE
jgi:hypothetical protein